MATASFDKSFVVKDRKSIDQFKHDLESVKAIKVKAVDYSQNKEKGRALLKQFLSS